MNVYHLSAVISFVRHGEKDNDGNLTQRGLQQAIETGLRLRDLKGNIFINHSGVGRVQKTAQAISQFLHNSPDEKDTESFKSNVESFISGADQGVNNPEAALDELHYVYDRLKPSKYFSKWIPVDKETATKRAQTYLDLKTKSPEPETTPSPKEMAQRGLKTLISQLETSLSTSYDTKENYINTTHEPVVLSMLYYLFEDFTPKTKDFVEKIGGSFDFAEGFDINVYQDESDKPLIYLDFREFLKPLDLKKIKEFVHE